MRTATLCLLTFLATLALTTARPAVDALGRTVFNTTITLQVVINPPLRRGYQVPEVPVNTWQSLADTGAELVRFSGWFPYPRLAVAQLYRPTTTNTFWDFTLIDPLVEDYMNAMQGRRTIINFCTIPQWMFKTNGPIPFPSNPDEPIWNYEQGTDLVDPTCGEVATYFANLFAWYTQGGFTDELGVFHRSDFHYTFNIWEILNEGSHGLSKELYTQIYDAIVSKIRAINPQQEFMGLALGSHNDFDRYKYFLNQANHRPTDTPIHYISFHQYALPSVRDNSSLWNFFDPVNDFIKEVDQIVKIRDALNPKVQLDCDEFGSILPGDPNGDPNILPEYWVGTGNMYAYAVAKLSLAGLSALGQSQLMGYPSQYPSVSLVDWNTGKPNPRLLCQNLVNSFIKKGDLVKELSYKDNIYQFGIWPANGDKYRVLVLNELNKVSTKFSVEGVSRGTLYYIDLTTGTEPYRMSAINGPITLRGWATAFAVDI